MDAAALQMLADLGVQRRDIISAPEEGGRGRRGRGGGDGREEMHAMEEAEKHRQLAKSGPQGNAKADMLRLWNSESTFGSDAIADSLENRMDGQGHRLRLREQLGQQHARLDGDDHRSHRNYRHDGNDHPPPGRGRPSEQDRTPRDLSFAVPPPPRQGPAPDPNRARAPSPRAAGVTRFKNGQRVTSGPTPTSSSTQAPRLPAAMRPNGVPSQLPAAHPTPLTAQLTQAQRSSPQPAPKPSSAQMSRPAPAVNAPSRPIDAPQPARALATAMAPDSAPTPRPRTAVTAAPAVATSPTAPTAAKPGQLMQARFHAMARGCIECPSEIYEKYYKDHPEEVPYIEHARKDLAMEAVKCVRNGQQEVYIKQYPDRTWLVEIAETALTRGDPESGNALTKPTVQAIIRAANEQKKKDGQMAKENAAKFSAPSTPAFSPVAPATTPKPSQPSPTVPLAAPVPTPSASIPPSQPRPTSTPSALKDMVQERGDLAIKMAASRRTEGSQTASSSVVATNGPPSRCDSVMDTSSPAAAPQRVPAPARGGVLTATYQDATGKIVKQDQTRVDAPVMATITIASTKHHYDPRQLMAAMQALAQEMADRTMGNFRKGDDDLWDEAATAGWLE